MKNKLNILLLISGLVVAMVINSCKKDNTGSIKNLFTGGKWQLASITATNYIGNSQTSSQVLDSACMQTQFFTFNTDGTCNYTNFDCIEQISTTAAYSLTPNQLFLNTAIVCKDTTAAGSSMPFTNAAIVNLGKYSMVLQTGDIAPNYSLTQKRRIVQYGFVRQTAAGQ